MITILDYGAGNLRSVQNTLDAIGAEYKLVRDAAGRVDRMRLMMIETTPAYRQAGIGEAMLEQVEAISQAHGAREVYGDAPETPLERQWYEHHNYQFRNGGKEVYKTFSW